jgi:hypothetical protein
MNFQHYKKHGLVFVFLAATTLPFSGWVSRWQGFLIVIAAGFMFVFATFRELDEFEIRRSPALSLSVLFSIFLWHAVTQPYNTSNLLRGFGYVGFGVLCLIYIPEVFDQRSFIWQVNRLSGFVVLLGLPTAVIGAYSIAGLPVTPSRTFFVGTYFGQELIELYSVRAHILSRNAFSVLVLAGFITAVAETLRDRKPISYVFLGINSVGLYLSISRAAWMGAVIALILFVVARHERSSSVRLVVVLTLASVPLMIAVVIQQPLFVKSINFGIRSIVWEDSIQAVLAGPNLGYGLYDSGVILAPYTWGEYVGRTPHNSLARIFLYTGVVGGLAYCALLISSIVRYSGDLTRIEPVCLVALVLSLFVKSLFQGFIIFGLNSTAILAAIPVGYLVSYQNNN